ncbi:hypothetical protein JCM24511_01201 [Saitozyma sp. JCM 24511]|nr:hypothetical protein JCM24511_01201 [Saitozyma sp. JCM 24511]
MQTLRLQRWLETEYPLIPRSPATAHNHPHRPLPESDELPAGAFPGVPGSSSTLVGIETAAIASRDGGARAGPAHSDGEVVAGPDGDKDKDVDTEKGRDVMVETDSYLVDFEPNDPANPKNWSKSKKWLVSALLAQLCTMVGMAGSINSQAIGSASTYYSVSTELMGLDTALFLSGFGVASVIWAPLSELGGRNPVYVLAIFMLVLFEIGAALSDTLYARCIVRFLAGCAATPPLSNAGGGMGDIWTPAERSYAFTFFSVSGFFGPCLGPILGGWIAESYLGFRWAALELVIVIFLLPETFPPQVLKMKAAAIRKVTGEPRYMTALERARQNMPFRRAFIESLKRPFAMLVLEPIVQCMCIYLTVVYIILFGDLIAWTFIFEDTYGLSVAMSGTTFLSITVGLLVCGLCSPLMYYDYIKAQRRAEEQGLTHTPPEVRLRVAIVGTWFMPISLFWAAWVNYAGVSIWAELAAQAVFGFGILTTFIATFQYMIDSYANVAASGLAAITLLRYPVAGASVMFTGPIYERLGTHWALTLFGFVSLAISFIPIVFYIWGPKIRSLSRYVPDT